MFYAAKDVFVMMKQMLFHFFVASCYNKIYETIGCTYSEENT